MDHRFRKVDVRIKGVFVPILNHNRRQVEEIRKKLDISSKSSQTSDISQVFEVNDILRVSQAILGLIWLELHIEI